MFHIDHNSINGRLMCEMLYLSSVFNQKTLYNAYKKRTKNIQVDLEEYNRMRAADPEFYREASSLQYGKVCDLSFLSIGDSNL